MAILKRLSGLFSFTPAKPTVAATPSSPTVVEDGRCDSPVMPVTMTSKPNVSFRQHEPNATVNGLKLVDYNEADGAGSLSVTVKTRMAVSPGAKVDRFLETGSGKDDSSKLGLKRKADERETVEHVKRAKLTALFDEEDEGLGGHTLIDLTGEPDDSSSSGEESDRDDETWNGEDETLLSHSDGIEPEQPEKLEQWPVLMSDPEYMDEADAEETTAPSRPLSQPEDPATETLFVSESTLLELGWPTDTTRLVQKLHHRGREPIFPAHWKMDFHYLPEALFAAPFTPAEELMFDEASLPFVRSLSGKPDFHATKALSSLFQMPGRARDKVSTRLTPELLIERGIKRLIDWAYSDANIAPPSSHHRRRSNRRSSTGISPMPKLVITHTAPHTLDSRSLEDNVLARLINLRQDWTDHLGQDPDRCDEEDDVAAPTVYCVVISHTNLAVVAYAGTQLRQVGHFDLGEEGLDVWNALALAVVAVHVRNVCLAVRRERGIEEDGLDYENNDEEEDDPDA